MRLMYLTLAIVLAIGVSAASAQTDGTAESKAPSIAGVVKVISVSSLTLERSGKEIVFGVASSTRVISKGGSSDLLHRMPGPRVTDIVKAGDHVMVKYSKSGKALNAVEIRVQK